MATPLLHAKSLCLFTGVMQGTRIGQIGSSTGVYVTGVSIPSILQGQQPPVMIGVVGDWVDQLWEQIAVKAKLFARPRARVGERAFSGHGCMFISLRATDSRGCCDLVATNEFLGMSTESAKTAVDLFSANHGLRNGMNCYFAWVPSDMNLADACAHKSNYGSLPSDGALPRTQKLDHQV